MTDSYRGFYDFCASEPDNGPQQSDLFSAPPVAGLTPEAIQASRSGAQKIAHCWTERQSALLQVVRNAGSITRQDLAVVLKWPISSVCSVLDSVKDELVITGLDIKHWPDGTTTRRSRWSIR